MGQFGQGTMVSFIVKTTTFASLAAASFDGNLNYLSPSRRHAGLGIDVPKVAKRSLVKRATPWDPAQLNFTHGVASGDPYPSSVILWTRIAPSREADRSNVTVSGYVPYYSHETEKYIKASSNPVCVEYRVGTDKNLTKVVDSGKAYTTSDIDFTVKVSKSNCRRNKVLMVNRLRLGACNPSQPTITSSTSAVPRSEAHWVALRLALPRTTLCPRSVWQFSRAATTPMVISTHMEMLPARTTLTTS
jgi:hypothetical protein